MHNHVGAACELITPRTGSQTGHYNSKGHIDILWPPAHATRVV